jgi:putative transposase
MLAVSTQPYYKQPQSVSSRLLRMERPDIEKRYWKNIWWSPSYFAASCGGAPLGLMSPP